jgi:gamma-tubulin complex component 2
MVIEHQKVKPFSMNDVRDIRLQEALIIKDLLYVLMGLEGSYIRYSEKYNPSVEQLRMMGPDYKINKHLDASLKDVTKRMVLLSKMFSVLTCFTEMCCVESYGQVVQALVAEIRQFVKYYVQFLDHIEQQFKLNRAFTLRQFEQDLKSNITFKMKHLYDIVQSIYELNALRRRETEESAFDNFIDNIRQDLRQTGSVDLLSDTSHHHRVRGGLVLKIVRDKIDANSGDIKSREFLLQISNNISRGYVTMLNDWITKGQLNDQHNEFFITTNLARDFKVNSLNSEQYWDSKYVIKKDGLPKQFENKDVQLKVLLTGKYLNVLKECGVTLDTFSDATVNSLDSSNLYLVIEQCYTAANNYIMDLFVRGYNFREFIVNLEGYYLLNNASRFLDFMNNSGHELKRQHDLISVSRLKRNFEVIFGNDSNLVAQLLNVTMEKEPIYSYLLEILKVEAIDAEQALKSNNFESLKNLISQTLNVERETATDPKSPENMRGVNYFNMELILPFPLNLVATRTVMIQYQLVFRHLTILHHTDKQLTDTWSEINKNKIWKYKHFDKPIPKWISRARSLHDRMKDFIRIYMGFLTNDVIEKNWKQLVDYFDKIDDFEELVRVLQSYLNTVLKSSILTTEKLIKILSRLVQIINAYCTFLMSLRKVLILLNYDLFEKYNDRLRDQEYDHNKNLERLERLNSYLNEYLDSFGQHLGGFVEGLRYYGELETTDFILLATRLEQAFPERASEQ